jgi:hypothetical protein
MLLSSQVNNSSLSDLAQVTQLVFFFIMPVKYRKDSNKTEISAWVKSEGGQCPKCYNCAKLSTVSSLLQSFHQCFMHMLLILLLVKIRQRPND